MNTNELNNEKRDRILRTVRSLKEKTVANGCTEAEAMAASAKADELLREYNLTLDEAFIEAETYGARRRNYGKARAIYHPALRLNSTMIATFTGTKVIAHMDEITNTGDITFFGTPMDTELAFFLLDHIKAAVDTAWKVYAAALRKTGIEARVHRRAFEYGMTSRINDRMAAMIAARQTAQQGATNALVVIKDAVVADRFRKWQGELKGRIGGSRKAYIRGSRETFERGRAAGDAVSLNRPLSGAGSGSSQRRLG